MEASVPTSAIRELFIEELAEVKGGAGDPIRELYEKLGGGNSTEACCEEGQCCVEPI